jgi:uncharacterized protein (TIGR00255 family)
LIKSMTGFGRGVTLTHVGKLEVEVRSLNHRYLEITTRLPHYLQHLEDVLKKCAAEKIQRGKVTLTVTHDEAQTSPAQNIVFHEDAAHFYIRHLQNLRRRHRLNGELNLVDIACLPQVVTIRKAGRASKKLGAAVKKQLERALTQFDQSRGREGRNLLNDLLRRIRTLKSVLRKIDNKVPKIVSTYQKRLQSRIQDLAGDLSLDDDRIQREVAIFAEKSDISEEIVRCRSHLAGFEGTLKKKGSIGRSLDFMTQELFREINTIGSKTPDTGVSHLVIEMKGALEKIKEQVQNVE